MPKLTVGMAVYDDYDGVVFTIQAIRIAYPELYEEIEYLVVDNNPKGLHGQKIKQFLTQIPNSKYIEFLEPTGTAQSRNEVFKQASGEIVLCLDCHVLLWPNSITRLLNWFEDNPDFTGLIQGPMVYDNMKSLSTYMFPKWRHYMFGTFHADERGMKVNDPEFEIPMQGLGLFCCRKNSWLEFNHNFRGFGGEEGYIHEKYRQCGSKTLCLPFLKWWHRFGRIDGVPYQTSILNLVRNYLIGWLELKQWVQPVALNFATKIGETVFAEAWKSAVETSEGDYIKEGAIDTEYLLARGTASDINQHLPTLRLLARQCKHITEFGVRTGVSTRALLAGEPDTLISYDINPFTDYFYLKKVFPGNFEFFQQNVLDVKLVISMTDMLFIDTLHTYEQLKKELTLHCPCVKRYIVLHDTTAFGEVGEDGKEGLSKTIKEFLEVTPEWFQIVRLEYNNGLTVLGRKSETEYPPVE